MSVRKKGDEHASQEYVGTQSLRSAKDKEKDKEKGAQSAVAGVTAAAVAATAKLERVVHAADHAPNKGGQQAQTKSAVDRRSQSHQSIPTSATGTKNITSKGTGVAGKEPEASANLTPSVEGEPSLKDILLAINSCKQSLGELGGQMKDIKEELTLVRHELKKTAERVTEAERRISQIEDDLHPMKQEVKAWKEKIIKLTEKFDEMENRLRRDNVRVVGLPEGSEGSDPMAFLERWLIETFGRETFSQQFSIERAHRVPFRPPPRKSP